MRNRVALVGIVLALVGLVLAQSPAVAPDLDAPDVVVTALATIALLAGLYRAKDWPGHDPRESVPAQRERRREVTVPGDDVDRRIADAPSVGATAGDMRLLKTRQDLRAVAVEVLTRFRGYSEEEATTALDEGTWTEDPLAAELFTTRSGTGDSVREAVTGSLYGRGPFYRRAMRAAAAIERMTRGDAE